MLFYEKFEVKVVFLEINKRERGIGKCPQTIIFNPFYWKPLAREILFFFKSFLTLFFPSILKEISQITTKIFHSNIFSPFLDGPRTNEAIVVYDNPEAAIYAK